MVNKLGIEGENDLGKCPKCGICGCDGKCEYKNKEKCHCGRYGCDGSCININIIKIFDDNKNNISKEKCSKCGIYGCDGSCKIDILNIFKPNSKPGSEEFLIYDKNLDLKKLPNLDDLNCISQERIEELKNKLKEYLSGINLKEKDESELGGFLIYLGKIVNLYGMGLSLFESNKGKKNKFQEIFFEKKVKKVNKLDEILTKKPTNNVQEKIDEATSIINGIIEDLDILSGEQIKEKGDRLLIIGFEIFNSLSVKNIIKK